MHADHGARRGLRALVLVIVVTFAAVTATAEAAGAAGKPPTSAALGASWIANEITANGGFLKSFGAADPTSTAYGVIGMHAAKVGGGASDTAIAYLETQLGSALQANGHDAPGALAYYILAAASSGVDPHSFGGSAPANDLVARLLATQHTSGADAGLFGAQDPTFDGAFRQGVALAALKAAKVKKNDPHITAGLAWLTAQQCSSGLFEAYRADTSRACDPPDPINFTGPDTNSTGMALQGLAAWGKKPHKQDVPAALLAVQSADGGFGFIAAAGQPSDPDSTALVIQGLIAYGSKPSKKQWKKPGGDPYSALASYQLGCADAAADRGAYFFPGSRAANTFATVQAVPASASRRFPVPKTKKLKATVAPECPTGARRS